MSGLETLGVVGSIMTVITFACHTVTLCRKVYHGESSHPQLSSNAVCLTDISAEIQQHFQDGKKEPAANASEKRLKEVAKNCNEAAEALSEEINFITKDQKSGNLRTTLRVAFKTNRRKRHLDELEKKLLDSKSIMETAVLANVCTTADAIRAKHSDEFGALKSHLRSFISQYAAGYTKMEDLIKEGSFTREHTTKEVSRADASIKTHVNTAQGAITDCLTTRTDEVYSHITQSFQQHNIRETNEKERERMMGSFKFAAMNERRNQISDVLEGSFSDVFQLSESTFLENKNGYSAQDLEGSQYSQQSSVRKHHDSFVGWLQSNENLFWITGKPGSGKSTLVKFLLGSSLTRAALERWDPEAYLVSHFFWKPGNEMQRNVKGFLCSLLHQLVSCDESIINYITAHYPSAASKDSDTDWSVSELKPILLATLQRKSPICIFIDGVDEVSSSNSPSEVLEIIGEIKGIPRIKLCIASRPEPCLRLHLKDQPCLAIHDLNRMDMERYVKETLDTLWKNRTSVEFQEKLVKQVVYKAEGVFLWLRLVVRSLADGLQNDDPTDKLLERLEELPTDLSKLFSDMWTRTNGESKVYHRTAANYLNLVIAFRRTYGPMFMPGPRQLTLFCLMSATNLSTKDAVTLGDDTNEREKLDILCHKTQRNIETRCAGLLEAIPVTHKPVSYDTNCSKGSSGTCGCYRGANKVRIQFVHRSALDFLVDTEEGRRIRQYDPSSKNKHLFQLCTGDLVRHICFHDTVDCAVTAIEALMNLKDPIERPSVEEMLGVCEVCCNKGFLPSNHYRSIWRSRGNTEFLSFLVSPVFHDYVADKIARDPDRPRLATAVLGNVFDENNAPWLQFNNRCELARRLLSLGADPNVGKIGLQTRHFPEEVINDVYFNIESAFSLHLWTVIDGGYPTQSLGDPRPLLSAFFRTTPDLDSPRMLAVMIKLDENRMSVRNLDVHDLTAVHRPRIELILRVNLVFLIKVAVAALRWKGADGTSSSAQFLRSPVPSLAGISFVVRSEPRRPPKSYKIVDKDISEEVLQWTKDWLCGDFSTKRQTRQGILAQANKINSAIIEGSDKYEQLPDTTIIDTLVEWGLMRRLKDEVEP